MKRIAILVAAILMLARVGHGQNPSDGLIAYYPFNGNALDESGNGNDGIVEGAMLTQDRFGNSNRAYFFDGTTRIVAPNPFSVSGSVLQPFTISAWVKSTTEKTAATILSEWYGCGTNPRHFALTLRNEPDNNQGGYPATSVTAEVIGVETAVIADRNKVADDLWHHLVFVRSATAVSVYLDGNLENSKPASPPNRVNIGLSITIGDILTGTGCAGNDHHFEGLIDDIRIYDRTLTEEEIQSLLNQPPTANAGPDQTVECTGPEEATVMLDGTGSNDPDGDDLTYAWTGPFGTATDPTPTVLLPHGIHTITLTVDDGGGETASDEVVITVEDTTEPLITLIGESEITLECPAPYVEPGATVTDACDPGPVLVIDNSTVDTSTPGTFTVTYTANDTSGNQAVSTRTVHAVDTTPPEVIAALEPVSGGDDGDDDGDDDDSFAAKSADDDDDGGDEEEVEGTFTVVCTTSDTCDTDPTISSVVIVPALSDPTVTFKVKNKKRLKIDLDDNEVKVHGPDPQAFWAEVQASGGVAVMVGQELDIEQEGDEDEFDFRFDGEGYLAAVEGPSAVLRCAATDASGNTATAEATPSASGDEDGDDEGDDDDGADKTGIHADQSSTTEATLPKAFALEQNYPNPFNPATEIQFSLPEAARVQLVVFDVTGREIARLVESTLAAGIHRVAFDATALPSGVYLYRLTAGRFTETKQMVLTK